MTKRDNLITTMKLFYVLKDRSNQEKVFELMCKISDFNLLHPNMKITSADFIDTINPWQGT